MRRYENPNRSPVSASYVEPHPRDEPLGAEKIERLDSQGGCRIHIHSIRKRLADTDGISAKALLDGIVLYGLLPSDRQEVIECVTFSQEKTKGEEITVVEIEIGGNDTCQTH